MISTIAVTLYFHLLGRRSWPWLYDSARDARRYADFTLVKWRRQFAISLITATLAMPDLIDFANGRFDILSYQ